MFIPKRGARIIAPNITITIAVMGMEAESRGLRCCLWRVPVGLLVVILEEGKMHIWQMICEVIEIDMELRWR